jgi:hypothetical protein
MDIHGTFNTSDHAPDMCLKTPPQFGKHLYDECIVRQDKKTEEAEEKEQYCSQRDHSNKEIK